MSHLHRTVLPGRTTGRWYVAHAIAVLLLVAFPSIALAADPAVQAESFAFANDIAREPIAANGSLLYGLDYLGEWTQYAVTASSLGTYSVTMRCWGDANVAYHLRLVTIPSEVDGFPQSTDFNFIGKGNCGS